ncbi:MAG TPA: sigma-70 family RNA polymerase sigma factor [Kofleriaceae bacterium]|nr:sigma-70 family RNA polymerase sigma factor [Kofleriaceae bacterium]
MSERHPLVAEVHEARRRFLELVAAVRPQLHRYCARMLGSLADGEDVVQDTLARAYYALAELDEIPALRPWLFQIAHNRAIDLLRRHDRQTREPLDVADDAADPGPDAEDALAGQEAVRAAMSRFLELAPAQRSAVILKDVLGHSLDEIAALLGLTVPAVKAALHRGRVRLRALEAAAPGEASAAAPRQPSEAVARYAQLFNARDWDAVRAMLAEDVELDLVSVSRRAGRRDVGVYVARYASMDDWRLVPAWLDGREVLAVFHGARDPLPGYFIELVAAGGKITAIRDFRHVRYIAVDARFDFAAPPAGPTG